MKVALIIADGVRQVMFTAEGPMETQALELLGKAGQDITVDFKRGEFYDGGAPPSAIGFVVSMSQGGYLRAYRPDSRNTSLMLILRDKQPEPEPEPELEPTTPVIP